MIRTKCPECATGYEVPIAALGKVARCKACDQRFTVSFVHPLATPKPVEVKVVPAATANTGLREYPGLIDVEGDGGFAAEVVGESHYQDALEAICGGRGERGHELLTRAVLVQDDENAYDPKAVRVDIKGLTVGHLNRDDARQYRERLATAGHPRATIGCPAVIVGGWDDGKGSRGHFGVRLDLPPLYGRGCRSGWKAAMPVVYAPVQSAIVATVADSNPLDFTAPLKARRDGRRCDYCDEVISDRAIKCPHCAEYLDDGLRRERVRATSTGISPGVAAILSLLLPGVGQLCQGKAVAGVFWFVLTFVGYITCIVPGLILHLLCVVSAASHKGDS